MATQAFLDKWREGGGELRHLLLLTAARDDGSQSDTVYLADHEVATLANVVLGITSGKLWTSAVASLSPLSCPGAFCGTDVPLCSCSVTLNADKAVVLPAGGGSLLNTTLRQMVRTHVMTNATATVYRHIEGQTGAGDAQALGPFRVVAAELEGGQLMLQLRQGTDWDKPVAPRLISKQSYPRAPDDVVGMPLPVIYGANRPRPTRRPWLLRYPYDGGLGPTHEAMYAGIAHGVSRALLIDTGRLTSGQNSNLKVLVAGHQCEAIAPTRSDVGSYLEAGELLSFGVVDVVNTATECGFTALPNWPAIFQVELPVNEVLAPANSAYNAAHILARSDSQFALLDQTAGYKELQVRMPSAPPELGTPLAMRVRMFYRSSTVLTGLKASIYNDALAVQDGGPYTVTASTDPVMRLPVPSQAWTTWAAPFPTSPWAFGSDRIVRVFFDQTASPAGWCRVFALCIRVTFSPKQQVIQSERIREETVQQRVAAGQRKWGPYTKPIREPAVVELRGKFWANVRGLQDDGSGTYTGTAGALIQQMPDIIRHLLVTYGGVTAGEIETGTATFGSLVAARADLVDSQGRALTFGYPITTTVDLMAALGQLGESALAMPMISPYDGKWRLIVWRESPAVTYPWKFSRWDVIEELGPVADPTPLPEVVTGIRINYAYDERLRATTEQCVLAFDQSAAGYLYFGLRDQYATVVASINDRLDFKPSGGAALAASLTAADYATVQAFCSHLKTQMDAAAVAASSSARFLVGAGGTIQVGYNDRLAYNAGATDRYVGLPDGADSGITGAQAPYQSMLALAYAAMRKLNYSATRTCSAGSGVTLITVTDAMRCFGLRVGMEVSGTGFAANTTITAINEDANQFTINNATTGAVTAAGFLDNRAATYGSGSPTVTLATTAGLTRGMRVSNVDYAVGTVITTVNSSTQLTLSANSAGAGSGVAMSFAVSGDWILNYAPATDSNEGKVTVTKAAGTRTILAGASATDVARSESGWASLGFTQLLGDLAVPASPTLLSAHDDRFVDHVWIQSLHSVTDYLFQSGTNGADSATAVRHCGELVGATASSDILGSDSTHGSVCFYCPKGVREQALKKSATRYGARREVALEARAVYETDAALVLRNRLADLLGKPRTTIRFSTTKAPDIERGHVFQFWPDMDELTPYPGLGSDGLWAGKRFIVTDVTHYLGPTSRSTAIVAVDVT